MFKVLYLFLLLTFLQPTQSYYVKILAQFFQNTGLQKMLTDKNYDQFMNIIRQAEDQLAIYSIIIPYQNEIKYLVKQHLAAKIALDLYFTGSKIEKSFLFQRISSYIVHFQVIERKYLQNQGNIVIGGYNSVKGKKNRLLGNQVSLKGDKNYVFLGNKIKIPNKKNERNNNLAQQVLDNEGGQKLSQPYIKISGKKLLVLGKYQIKRNQVEQILNNPEKVITIVSQI